MPAGGSSCRPLTLAVGHGTMRVNNQYSTTHSVASVFWILCFLFLHPIASTKCPPVSPASGWEKSTAITLEMKLKAVPNSVLIEVL